MGLFSRKKKDKNIGAGMAELVVPVHIAIIPDGNRRWARERMLPVKAGHKEGAEIFKRVVRHAEKLGVRYITFYAFSTENWKRSETEVEALMSLMLGYLKNSEEEMGIDKGKLRIRVIGDRTALSEELQQEIARVEDETKDHTKITLNLAINYGGRDEITKAVRKIAADVKDGNLAPEDIKEETIGMNLYTGDTPDPDLLIRTSGEERISNYLLWQLAYSEFYFTEKYWPDFHEEELEEAIREYSKRQRRYGG